MYGNDGTGDASKKTDPVRLGFDSALSIGTDESANAVIISAQEEVFDTVVDLIKELDQKAESAGEDIVVHYLSGVNAQALTRAARRDSGQHEHAAIDTNEQPGQPRPG